MTPHDDIDSRLRAAVRGALATLAMEPPPRRTAPLPLGRGRGRVILAVALACIVALLATTVALGHRNQQRPLAAESGGGAQAATTGTLHAVQLSTPAPSRPAAAGGNNGIGPKPQPTCAAGHNGGATDVGVTSTSITLAMTTADTGVMAGVVGQARLGVLAAVNRINRAGGICSRQLRVQSVDDGGDPARGRQDIDTFINSGQVFALVAMPSQAGLDAAIAAGDIDRADMPVVGNDLMLADHVSDPWVWPVATTTVATMRVTARDAHLRGARTFALVYDDAQPNADLMAGAFSAQVRRDGDQLDPACVIRLRADQSDYSSQANQFNNSCGAGRSDGGVDFVMVALNPAPMTRWLSDASRSSGLLAASHPYLGVRSDGTGEGAGTPESVAVQGLAQACPAPCQLRVWSGLYPVAAPYDSGAAMQQYRQALLDTSPSADPGNPYTEAAYAGTELLIDALERAGPILTRSTLARILDGIDFTNGITVGPIHYADGARDASQQMQGFLVSYDSSSRTLEYTGATGVYGDPCATCSDPPSTG